jgi:hypothetical protein
MNSREYLTAIDIEAGIIKLIDPEGNVVFYRQRNIQRLPKMLIADAIASGKLHPNWERCPELPRNWSIAFEEPSIQGRAIATFPMYLKYKKSKS